VKWTTFYDYGSGGYDKTPHTGLIVRGSVDHAALRVQDVLSVDVHASSCRCCGPDFGIEEHDSFQDAVEYRGLTPADLAGVMPAWAMIVGKD
jgi:hypothetical protein